MERIHKFECNGKKVILDVFGGAVHVVDDLVYDIVDDIPTMTCEQIANKYSKYSKKNIIKAASEIRQLIQDGDLFVDPIEESQIHYNPQKIIKAMCLNVSHDCDLRCTYCFASQGDFKGERKVMSLETGKKALDFLVKNSGNRKNLEVDFFGGEPLLNFEVVKSLVFYGMGLNEQYGKNIRFTLTTNGMGLNEERIDFINQYMKNVVLSLDGRKKINDMMRPTRNQRGSYDIIIPKFKQLIKQRGDKEYYIRGTFTANNLDFGQDIKHFYDLGFKNVSMEPVVTDPKESYALLPEHLSRVLKEYEDFAQEYISIKKQDKDFLFFHYLIDLNGGPCLAKRSVGCGAGVEYICVTPQEEIYPCHQFVGEKDFIIGSLDKGIMKTGLVEEFRMANVFHKKDCKECWAKFYCSGGCHANAYYNNGSILKPYQLGCEMEKKRIECAISILASLEEE